MTSLCATCDSSCAMTPSSSSGFSQAHQAVRHAQHGMLAVAAGGEGVRQVGRGDRDPRLGHVRQRADPVDDAVQFRCLLGGHHPGLRRGQRDLVRVEEGSDRRAAAEHDREEHDRAVGGVQGHRDPDDCGDKRHEYEPEQEHGQAHPDRQSPVGRIPSARHHVTSSSRARAGRPALASLLPIYPGDAGKVLNVPYPYADRFAVARAPGSARDEPLVRHQLAHLGEVRVLVRQDQFRWLQAIRRNG